MQEQIHRAIKLAHAGHRDDALELLRATLTKNPREAAAWKWLAYLSPDAREALNAARQLEAISPGDAWLNTALPALRARAAHQAAGPPVEPRRGVSPVAYSALIGLMLLGVVVLTVVLGEQLAPRAGTGAIVAASGENAAAPSRLLTGGRVSRLSRLDPALAASAAPAARVASTNVVIPDVDVHTETQFYTFEAATEEEIRAAVYNGGPTLKTGQRSIAMTSYQMWVQWKARQTVNACQMTEAVVNLNVTYTLPQWSPVGEPPAALFDEWQRFYTHVADHEEHHGLLARECAHQLVEQLKQLESQPTCTEVESAINTAVDDAYTYCEGLQTGFDAEFGRTSFPLPAHH